MSSITRTQRRYDLRLRELVQTSGDFEFAIWHGVPRSTARGGLTTTGTEVVTLDVLDLDTIQLQHEVSVLRRRIARLVSMSMLRLLVNCVSYERINRPQWTPVRIGRFASSLMG